MAKTAPATSKNPCAKCRGITGFIVRFVDQSGNLFFIHDTCVGAWLMDEPGRALQFCFGEIEFPPSEETRRFLMKALYIALHPGEATPPGIVEGVRAAVKAKPAAVLEIEDEDPLPSGPGEPLPLGTLRPMINIE